MTTTGETMADLKIVADGGVANFAVRYGDEIEAAADGVLAGSLGQRPPRAVSDAAQAPRDPHNAVLWSVIGDDDQLTALFTRLMPERLVCSFIIHGQGRTFHGSGWLAGPRLVMTCGHNVHHDDFGGWAERIEVIPGRTDGEWPFGSVVATRFSAHDRWIDARDPSADIACLHLEEPIGHQLGWFAIAQADEPDALVGQPIASAGYPEYQGDFTRQRRGDGVVAAIIETRLFHTADTTDGSSGGPIWLIASGDTPPTAVAVHAYEKILLAGPPQQEANSGTLIDPAMLALIAKWRNVLPAA